MNIHPDQVPNLRSLLGKIDALRADREELAAKIAPADAAVRRLREQLAGLEADAKRAADIIIPIAPDRVSQLIAGASVAQPDRKAVDDAAAKARQIGAQRAQGAEDLAALHAHIADLSGSAATIDAAISAAEGDFLAALAEAALDAYKRDATALVSTHIPQLHSIVRRLRQKTGQSPHWGQTVFAGLKVLWYEDEIKQPTPNHQPMRDQITLWPRIDGTLASGESVFSDDLVDGLIAEIQTASV